jgi:drug/metabolite transporter (DMT)-like permease
LDLKGLETISAGLERLTLFTYPIFTAILGAIFFSTPLTKRIVIVNKPKERFC